MFNRVGAAAAALTLVVCAACASPFGPQYEYEEQLYLSVDGSASVTIDASIPALVALRGVPLDPSPDVAPDRDAVRRIYQQGGCDVINISRPWRRLGRRFIQIRVRASDVRALGGCQPLRWSIYDFTRANDEIKYSQRVGASADGAVPNVNWDGSEIVAVKLHLPSRIRYQDSRRLDRDESRPVDRGNIVTYEQKLSDRRAGKPIEINVTMDPKSILYLTLWLFAGAFGAAVIALVAVLWGIKRRGRLSRPRA